MVKLNAPLDIYLLEEISPFNKPASKFKRLFNLVVDYCFVFVLLIVVFFVLILAGAEEWVPTREHSEELTRQVISVGALFIYYVITEYFWSGKSLGKFITRTKVIMQNGDSPNLKAVLYRAFTRFIPFEFLSLLVDNQTWHDRLSGTIVIEETN